MAFFDVFFRLSDGEVLQPFFVFFSEINGDFFHGGKDDQHIRSQLFCQETAGEIFVDHRGRSFEMISLQSDGNASASAADHDLIGVHKAVDGVLFHDLHRFRGSHDSPVAPSRVFLHDISICLLSVFRLFLCHKMSDRLAWILKSGIVRIHPYLSDYGDDRRADETSFSQLFTERILEIVADIRLTHCHTDGEGRVGLIGILPGEGRHGVVDHAYLGAVSMDDHYLMTVFDKVAEGLRRGFYSDHLLRERVPQGVAAKSDDDTFAFVHVKTS